MVLFHGKRGDFSAGVLCESAGAREVREEGATIRMKVLFGGVSKTIHAVSELKVAPSPTDRQGVRVIMRSRRGASSVGASQRA